MKRIQIRTSFINISLGLIFSVATNTYANACLTCCPKDPYEYWGGGYFGAFFAAGRGDADTSLRQASNSVQTIVGPSQNTTIVNNEKDFGKLNGDTTGSISGLLLGYNFHPRCSRIVFGAQLEGTVFSDINFNTSGLRNENSTSVIT